MYVIPIVIRFDVLRLHVALVYLHGGGECLFGSSVIAGPIKNVSRHMHHVAGCGRKAGQDLRAMQGLFRMRAGLDRVNPVMIGR